MTDRVDLCHWTKEQLLSAISEIEVSASQRAEPYRRELEARERKRYDWLRVWLTLRLERKRQSGLEGGCYLDDQILIEHCLMPSRCLWGKTLRSLGRGH